MKAVLQRVRRGCVEVEGQVVGKIDHGLVVFLGVAQGDSSIDAEFMVGKLPTLRIFSDEQGKMNRSLEDVGGGLLIISQFTLLANTERGRRPSFEDAAPPEEAKAWYQSVIGQLRDRGLNVEAGIFGAAMVISLENDGPVTLLLDSRRGS